MGGPGSNVIFSNFKYAYATGDEWCGWIDANKNLLLTLSADLFNQGLDQIKVWLNENPVTAVYTLATPETYTSTPTPFISAPATDGSVAISGQTGGEMSATYNKSIPRALQELQTAVQALQAPSQPAAEPIQPETEPSGEVAT